MPEDPKPLTVRWNKLLLDAIKLCKTSPPLAARALAMVHTAMFDAWSVYDKCAVSTTTAKYIKRRDDDCEEGDILKAISFAAFRVLTHLFWLVLPAENRKMFRELMYECEYDPDDCSYDTKSPQGIGNLMAKLTLDYRRGDEANQEGILYYAAPWFDFAGYRPKNPPLPAAVEDINHWQPLIGGDGKPQNFLAAHWALVKPFALKYAWQFRPAPPYTTKDSPSDFRKQAEEVFEISQHLSDEQKAIAEYWSDGPGTVTPPGHWCEIAQYIADTNCKDYSEANCVKLFFVLSNALLDVSIACWESKRKYDAVRPITAIHEFLKKTDWNSYIPTPPFPEQVSGHSSFSMAAATILKYFTGSDEFGAVGVLEKGKSLIEPGKPLEDIQLPIWKTFTAAAEEAGMSRLYGGIHFRKGNEDGQKLGEAVGVYVWEKAQFYFNDK